MFGLTKKMFLGLLTDLINRSNHTKFVSLSNQKSMSQPTLINLHPNEKKSRTWLISICSYIK